MGQKSNLLTLRDKNQNILTLHNSKQWASLYNIFNLLDFFFNLKEIWIINKNISFNTNIFLLNLQVYYQTSKISKYRKKLRDRKVLKKRKQKNIEKLFEKKLSKEKNVVHIGLNFFKSNQVLFKLFKSFKNTFKINRIAVKFTTLNKFISRSRIRRLHRDLKKYIRNFFARRYSFYFDFLKVTCLFLYNKISLEFYLKFFNVIFKYISKKFHVKYVKFVRKVFVLLMRYSKRLRYNKRFRLKNKTFQSVKGVKFLISGRIQGKDRGSSKSFKIGNVPNQTLSKSIDYNLSHVYTLYGVYGIKIWIYKK